MHDETVELEEKVDPFQCSEASRFARGSPIGLIRLHKEPGPAICTGKGALKLKPEKAVTSQ